MAYINWPTILGALLEFVRDTELFIPGFVEAAVAAQLKCLTKGGSGSSESNQLFLKNLSQLLQHQALPERDQPIRVLSDFSSAVKKNQAALLTAMADLKLVRR